MFLTVYQRAVCTGDFKKIFAYLRIFYIILRNFKKFFRIFCDRLPCLSVVMSEGQNNTGKTARVIGAGTIV